MKKVLSAKEESRGVFWVVDDELISYPYYEGESIGVAKSGSTYNHKNLWKALNISKKPYNYYPRGRVEFDGKGRPIIYMNPNIDDSFIPNIKSDFGLRSEPKIHYDNSNHYKCYLDDGWRADK